MNADLVAAVGIVVTVGLVNGTSNRRAEGGQTGFDFDAPPPPPPRPPSVLRQDMDRYRERAAADISIVHTPQGGTVIEGSTRAYNEVLKRHGLRWSGRERFWYVRGSRDRKPDAYKIERLAADLRAAGATVAVQVDDAMRPTAEREAARAERLEGRQERLEERGERIGGAGQEKWERAGKMWEAIPFGQPILVGHHSERRDRNYRDRAANLQTRGHQEMTEGRRLTEAAESSRHQQARRESVPVTLRRIAKLEAERRGYLRELAEGEERIKRQSWSGAAKQKAEWLGMSMTPYSAATVERLNRQVAEADEEIAHWRGVVSAAESSGVKLWGPKDFTRGDIVHHRGRQSVIVRVNPKSVSVKTPYSWTDTVPYDDVTGRTAGVWPLPKG